MTPFFKIFFVVSDFGQKSPIAPIVPNRPNRHHSPTNQAQPSPTEHKEDQMKDQEYIAFYGVGNHPSDYINLPQKDKTTALEWVNQYVRRTRGKMRSSYGLKHALESYTGLYTTNGQFKAVMREAGFKAHDTDDINWGYCVKVLPKRESKPAPAPIDFDAIQHLIPTM